MSIENMNIDFSDIKNYWLTLFPEIHNESEFNDILMNVSHIGSEDLEKEIYNTTDNEVEKLIENFFTCKKHPLLENIVSKVESTFPFYGFYEPIVNYYASSFYERVRDISVIENVDNIFISLVECLVNNLSSLAQRTLIFEVNIARMDGLLEGETPEERFSYFAKVLLKNSEYIKNMYLEYSVLTELLCVKSCNYFDYAQKIIEDVQNDYEVLTQKFNGCTPVGKLRKIATEMGDTHKGGKTVAIITFDTGFKIVYKPRCLDLEEGFQLLTVWINTQNVKGMVDLKSAIIHKHENYGWMEFIEYKECKNSSETSKFYQRTGELLCILYALNAQDFHHENLIAHGEYPVLIDLESLFHSFLQAKNPFLSNSTEIAQEILGTSVYSVGLLPQKITNRVDNNDISVEFSGLGAEEDQVSPFKVLVVKNRYSDYISVEKELCVVNPQQNNPRVDGITQKSDFYIKEIKRGFECLYNWILDNKELFADKITKLFSGGKSRFIIRPTYLYGQLLRSSYHPDFLREKIHRKVLLHRIGINANERIKVLLAAELKDLLIGDVPYFNVLIDSRIMLDSDDKKYNDFFDKSPMYDVIEKIINFSKFDLQRQSNIIDSTFLAKSNDAVKDITNVKFTHVVNGSNLDKKKWLHLAEKIGEYIVQKSIAGKDDRTWISTILEGKDEVTWGLAAVGNDLYTGNCGIALFLGYLGAISGKHEFTKAALEAIIPPMNEIENLIPNHPYLVGAYNGLSGYFYTLSQLSKIIKEIDFDNFIRNKIGILKDLASHDKVYEVIGGTAGSLGVVLSLYNSTNNSELKNILLDIGYENFKHLKSNSKVIPDMGVAWESNVTTPSTGFSHGNAGIVAYLSKLFAVTGDEEIISVIRKALEFERCLYTDEHRNWFYTPARERLSLGWCHGAPGILLSRIMLKNSGYSDEHLDNEIKIALDTTLSGGFGHNPSYCHGDLGNLAIVKYAAKYINDNNLENQCNSTYQDLFDNILSKRWNSGVLRGTESMSLLVGVAGFGYSLIKQCEPDFIPEILWFD